jgi:hypothetical protein
VWYVRYALLGRMTTYGEDFYSKGIERMLLEYVFVHLVHMQNRHLAPLLSCVPPPPTHDTTHTRHTQRHDTTRHTRV